MVSDKISRILYDGECGFCKRSVRFVGKHDGKHQFEFLPLQSPQGREWLKKIGFPEDYIESVVLVDEKGRHIRSDAVMETLRKLDKPWPLLYGLKVIPRPVRDFFYDFVAKKVRHWKIARKIFPCNGC
jgi:predicted DCC family thiol-disulfide oxidoreductase YuxK